MTRLRRLASWMTLTAVLWGAPQGLAAQTTAEPATQPTAVDSLDDVESILMSTLYGVLRDFIAHLPFLAVSVAVLLATWLAAALVGWIARDVLRRARMRPSLKDLLLKLVGIGVWVVGILLAAMVAFPGLTPSRALGGLGVASLAVSFAFKDTFENFFAGIMLLWRFPFENDDYIECGEISGRVEQITVRMTLVRSITGELVVLPNSYLFRNPLRVLTNPAKRRVSIVTGIAYGEEIEQALPVIEQAVNGCASVDGSQSVQVFPLAFGSSSIDIEVVWWTEPEPVNVRRSRGEVITAIKRALDDAGIEIPFPYRTLTFKDPIPMATRAAGGPGDDRG